MSTKRKAKNLLFVDISMDPKYTSKDTLKLRNLDLLSYQKNPRVMPSSLRKLFEALETIRPCVIESD